jgi:hypothetical protein
VTTTRTPPKGKGGKYGFLKDKRVLVGLAAAGGIGLVVLLKNGGGAAAGNDPNQTGQALAPSTYDSSSMDSYDAISQLGAGLSDQLGGYTGQLTDILTQLGAVNGPTSGTTPPATTTTAPKPGAPGALSGRVTTTTKTSIFTKFAGAANAVRYYVTLNGKTYKDVSGSGFTIPGLKPNTRYTVGIQAVNANGSLGPISNTTIRTKK